MNEVRIADLREPRRTVDEQRLFDYALRLEVDLDVADLIAEAVATAGSDHFGDTGVLDRLAHQVSAVEADVGLSGLGRFIIRQRLVGLLVARLRFEDYVGRYPEALETELEPPVIVVGLPRSGTTHLVNLLAADSRFRALPWWECVEPTPFPGDGPGTDGVDPRYLRAVANYELQAATAPLTSLMHDRHPSSIEEECELIDLDLCSYTLEWHARVPAWRDHYLTLDQDRHYAFLRRQLQVLSHLRGPRRWVLKTPQHLEQLGPLMRTFPAATIALTLRDPVDVLQSAITMLAYGDRLRRKTIEPDQLAAYWIARLEQLLGSFVRDLDLIPEGQRVDVEFKRFMADDLAMVERIYDCAGIGMTDTACAELGSYVAGNPRGKNGRVVYDLLGDFGLDPDEVRARFAFYLDRFPEIAPEVH